MDWYRRKTWTKEDEDVFFAKLGRARKDGRAQYLRIQAGALVETRESNLCDVAESLLMRLLTDYPDDNHGKSSALSKLGDIYKLRDDIDKAIEYYRQAVEFERIYPNARTEAWLELCELVIHYKKEDQYNFAEELMLENENQLAFPIQKYIAFSVLSVLNSYKNQMDMAKHYAGLAQRNAKATHSGFRYHKTLGLVTKPYDWLDSMVSEGIKNAK